MSDITLEALKLRERELEIDAVLIRGRVLEVRAMIEERQRRRGGRPRKSNSDKKLCMVCAGEEARQSLPAEPERAAFQQAVAKSHA